MKFDLYYLLDRAEDSARVEVVREQFRHLFSGDWQFKLRPTSGTAAAHQACVAESLDEDSYLVIAEEGVSFTSRTESVIRRSINLLAGRGWDLLYTEIALRNPEDAGKIFPRPVEEMLLLNNVQIHYLSNVAYTGARCYVVNKWSKHKLHDLLQESDPTGTDYEAFLRNSIDRGNLKGCVVYPFITESSSGTVPALASVEPVVSALRDAQPIKRIVLTRLDAIGDLICSTAGIRAVRKSWPDAHISLVCNQYNAPVVKNSRDIDALCVVEKNNTAQLTEYVQKFQDVDLAIALAPRIEDVAFVCATNARTRIGYTLLDFQAGCLLDFNLTKTLIPLSYPAVYDPRPEAKAVHEVEQVLALIEAAGGHIASPELSLGLTDEDHHAVAQYPAGLVLVPLSPRWFAGGASRDFVRCLLQDLRGLGRPVALTYDRSLAAEGERFAQAGCADFVIGDLPFLAWAALFRKAACVVSVDTSATHVASALKRPVVLVLERNFYYIHRQKWAPYQTRGVILQKPKPADVFGWDRLRQEIVQSVIQLLG